MAGPETPFARGELNLDEAMAVATAPSMAIAGAEQPQASTRGRVGVPPAGDPSGEKTVLDVSMQPAEYGWRPSQQDLGQGQVQSIATPTGPVPVAQVQMPFGAIASRQQAIAERRNAVRQAEQKAMAAFDPFKGIGDPADPYQTTFNKYITGQYFTKRKEMADAMFDGDTASFDKWASSTPDGQMWMRTNFTRPMDALAKENKGRVEQVANFLTEASELKWDVSPEDHRALQEYTTLIDDMGTPLPYADAEDLLKKGRAAEQVISKVRFQQQYLKGFAEFAQQNPDIISFERPRGAGGKIIMRVGNERVFDDYIDAMAQQAVDGRMFNGSEEAAKEWLRKLIKNKYDLKVSAMDPYESVERREAAKAKYGEGSKEGSGYAITVSPVPSADPTTKREELAFVWTDTVGGRTQQMSNRTFKTPEGRDVEIFAPQPTRENGIWVIRGRELSDRDKEVIEQERRRDTDGEFNTTTFVQSRNLGTPIVVPYSANKGQVRQYTGIDDLEATYLAELSKALAAKEYSVTPEELSTRSDEVLKRYVKHAGL